MRVSIQDTWNWCYTKGSSDYDEMTSELKKAQLPIIEVPHEKRQNNVHLFTEIKSLEDLNRLVEAFGCHIVYGDTDEHGTIIVEKYDDYRE